MWEKGPPVLSLVSSCFIFADPTISETGAGLRDSCVFRPRNTNKKGKKKEKNEGRSPCFII